jgi:hypothetical protein
MPIASGATPAFASAWVAAASAMSATDSSAAANRRSMMPVRSRIHSSEELIGPAITSLVTIRAGR